MGEGGEIKKKNKREDHHGWEGRNSAIQEYLDSLSKTCLLSVLRNHSLTASSDLFTGSLWNLGG